MTASTDDATNGSPHTAVGGHADEDVGVTTGGTSDRMVGARTQGPTTLEAAVVLGSAGYRNLKDSGRRLSATLAQDIQAIRERDPAAQSTLEVLTCYPGLHALWLHRLSHALWKRRVPLLPRLISQFGRFATGIEIHPGATIGAGLVIDHGAGVVIGETAEVGDNVTIYQGVTLGGTGKETGKRHPTVGDNVVIGAHSQLLGSITLGDNVKVGSGSVVIHDAPANTTVVGNPGRPVISEGTKVGIPDIDYTHLPDPVAEAMKCLVRRVVQLENELEELHKAVGTPTALEADTSEAKAAEATTSEAAPSEASPPDALGPPQDPSADLDAACDLLRSDGGPDL